MRLLKSKIKRDTDEYKEFERLMTSGKISNAIRCLTDEGKGGILSIDDTVTKDGSTKSVYDILVEKHQVAKSANESCRYRAPQKVLAVSRLNIRFLSLNLSARAIREASLKTSGIY